MTTPTAYDSDETRRRLLRDSLSVAARMLHPDRMLNAGSAPAVSQRR